MPFHIAPAIIIDATLYTLLAFSLITWVMIAVKVWQFAASNHNNQRYSSAFWSAADLDSAQYQLAGNGSGPASRVAECGFVWLARQKDPVGGKSLKFQGSAPDLLAQALRSQAHEEQKKLESGLTLLASIGSTAPFVGLFGTVLGIMHALHDISASGSASLDVVAGPIGDALIATAIGIAVAVPAVLAYNFFLRRAKHHRATLDHFVAGFLHTAFGEA